MPSRPPPMDQNFAWLCVVGQHVKRNAPTDSRLFKQFSPFNEQRNRPGDCEPSWGAKHMAWEAWSQLAAAEKSKILNGWRSHDDRPSAASVLAGEDDETVCKLEMHVELDGRVQAFPGFVVDSETAPVKVGIREGTDRATALAALRRIVATVERYYDALIQHDVYDFAEFGQAELGADVTGVEQALERVEGEMARVRSAINAQVFAPAESKKKPLTVSTHSPKLGGKGREKKAVAAR